MRTCNTRCCILEVTREENGLLTMTFPSRAGKPEIITETLIKGLGKKPKELYRSRDLMAVFENEDEIRNLTLDMELLKKLDAFGIIVTAKGNQVDFVSRFFAPRAGIAEDPVTGSSHCTLVPYWAERLGKKTLTAHQLSKRGGVLICEAVEDEIKISGKAVLFIKGEIYI